MKQYFSMKHYFEKLQDVGLEAIDELRKMDAKHADQLIEYREQVTKGESTEAGYQKLKISLGDSRAQAQKSYNEKLDALEEEFAAAVDEYTMPSASFMNMDDAEVLKNFELTPAEFERMAAKYEDNPTMGRMLEDYRMNHEGKPYGKSAQAEVMRKFVGAEQDSGKRWHTSWRFQDAEQRKAIFKSASNSVYFIINGTLGEDCAYRLKKRVSEEYHKLQGSDPNALPVPAAPEVKSAMDRLTERGGRLF